MLKDLTSLKEVHAGWLHEMLPLQSKAREDKWTTSIAVGGEKFVAKIKQLLEERAVGRRIVNTNGGCELREPSLSYSCNFIPENDRLRGENMHYWNIFSEYSLLARSDPNRTIANRNQKPYHALFFIKMHWWGPLLFVGGGATIAMDLLK